jgi:hypothetical protein
MPSLGGTTEWLNSEPLGPAELTCINWLRTAPYRREWDEKYRDHGLLVMAAN